MHTNNVVLKLEHNFELGLEEDAGTHDFVIGVSVTYFAPEISQSIYHFTGELRWRLTKDFVTMIPSLKVQKCCVLGASLINQLTRKLSREASKVLWTHTTHRYSKGRELFSPLHVEFLKRNNSYRVKLRIQFNTPTGNLFFYLIDKDSSGKALFNRHNIDLLPADSLSDAHRRDKDALGSIDTLVIAWSLKRIKSLKWSYHTLSHDNVYIYFVITQGYEVH